MTDCIGWIYKVNNKHILPFGKSLSEDVLYVLLVKIKKNSIAFFPIFQTKPNGIRYCIKIDNQTYYIAVSSPHHLVKTALSDEKYLQKVGKINEQAFREIKAKSQAYENHKKQLGVAKKEHKRNTSDVKASSVQLCHRKQLKDIHSFSQPCSGGSVNPR